MVFSLHSTAQQCPSQKGPKWSGRPEENIERVEGKQQNRSRGSRGTLRRRGWRFQKHAAIKRTVSRRRAAFPRHHPTLLPFSRERRPRYGGPAQSEGKMELLTHSINRLASSARPSYESAVHPRRRHARSILSQYLPVHSHAWT